MKIKVRYITSSIDEVEKDWLRGIAEDEYEIHEFPELDDGWLKTLEYFPDRGYRLRVWDIQTVLHYQVIYGEEEVEVTKESKCMTWLVGALGLAIGLFCGSVWL